MLGSRSRRCLPPSCTSYLYHVIAGINLLFHAWPGCVVGRTEILKEPAGHCWSLFPYAYLQFPPMSSSSYPVKR